MLSVMDVLPPNAHIALSEEDRAVLAICTLTFALEGNSAARLVVAHALELAEAAILERGLGSLEPESAVKRLAHTAFCALACLPQGQSVNPSNIHILLSALPSCGYHPSGDWPFSLSEMSFVSERLK